MKIIKNLALGFFLSLSLLSQVAHAGGFPRVPHEQVTPGKLCDRPVAYRYLERIAYCGRNVSYETKAKVIETYDYQFGYSIRQMDRRDFKIDHLIPLCAGGSNDVSNLWPQHVSVYELTDRMEEIICTKMAEGKISQKEAIFLILTAKKDLNKVQGIWRQVDSL